MLDITTNLQPDRRLIGCQQLVDEPITATQLPRLGPAGDIARLRRYLRLRHRQTP